jgi:hypothetical protein
MSHQTKMFLRLAAPAVLVFIGGMALAYAADAVGSLPVLLGGHAALTGAGNDIAMGTGVVSSAIYAFQMHRYWRWTSGVGDVCFVCSCILGREREGRFGPYRKCLGCDKNHAVGRI